MGYKTRSNYPVEACIRFDCDNREEECDDCIACNRYLMKPATTAAHINRGTRNNATLKNRRTLC